MTERETLQHRADSVIAVEGQAEPRPRHLRLGCELEGQLGSGILRLDRTEHLLPVAGAELRAELNPRVVAGRNPLSPQHRAIRLPTRRWLR